MASYLEQIIYAAINFYPYVLLVFLPFKDECRFTRKINILLFILFGGLEIFFFVFNDYLEFELGKNAVTITSVLMMTLRICFAFLIIKARKGRIVFTLAMIKNYADVVATVAKCLQGIMFPGRASILYDYSNTIALVIILGLTFYPMLYFINRNFSRDTRELIGNEMWNYLWIIPLMFYLIWIFLFYYCTDLSPLDLALKPTTSIFLIVLFAGQLFIYFCISHMVRLSSDNVLLQLEVNQLESSRKYYKTMQNHIEEVRIIKHDMRHHLRSLYQLADKGDIETLKMEMQNDINAIPSSKIIYSSNLALNLLLVYYDGLCKQNNIKFEINIDVPQDLHMSDSDITVLFGNLLENAYHAASSVINANRFINFKGKLVQSQLVLIVENSYDNEILENENQSFDSTKHEGKGLGIESSKLIVKRNNGSYSLNYEDSVYSVSIFIPYKENTKE